MGELHGAGKTARGRRDAALEPVVLDIDEAGQGGDCEYGQHDDDQYQFEQGKAVGKVFWHGINPLSTTNR